MRRFRHCDRAFPTTDACIDSFGQRWVQARRRALVRETPFSSSRSGPQRSRLPFAAALRRLSSDVGETTAQPIPVAGLMALTCASEAEGAPSYRVGRRASGRLLSAVRVLHHARHFSTSTRRSRRRLVASWASLEVDSQRPSLLRVEHLVRIECTWPGLLRHRRSADPVQDRPRSPGSPARWAPREAGAALNVLTASEPSDD